MDLLLIFAILSLIIGLVLVIKQPLAKAIALPRSLEAGTGTLFIFYFLFYVTSTYLVPMMAAEDEASGPCSAESVEVRCYNIDQASCKAMWGTFEDRCAQEVKAAVTPERASALLGPTIRQCAQRSYDQALKSSRKTSDNSDCTGRFKDLDAPRVE